MKLQNNRPSAGKLAYEQIRKSIILGELAAESKLKLSVLSKQYSVSMPTLRNVLHILAVEGFVVAEEQRGFFVSPLSKRNLKELVDLRFLLETHMIKVSLKQGDLEWEANVLAAYHRLQGTEKEFIKQNYSPATHPEEIIDLKLTDYEFHCALISGCGSKELLSIHKIVFDKYLRYLIYGIGFRGLTAMDEHKALVDSALSRDMQAVKAVLKTHIYECATDLQDYPLQENESMVDYQFIR